MLIPAQSVDHQRCHGGRDNQGSDEPHWHREERRGFLSRDRQSTPQRGTEPPRRLDGLGSTQFGQPSFDDLVVARAAAARLYVCEQESPQDRVFDCPVAEIRVVVLRNQNSALAGGRWVHRYYRGAAVMFRAVQGSVEDWVAASFINWPPGESVEQRLDDLRETVPSAIQPALDRAQITGSDLGDFFVGLAFQLAQDKHHTMVLW